MKKNQGITLIALIVTIIILIILAGIAIGLISGSEGLMSKTSAALDKNDEATATEKMELKITYLNMVSYGENTRKATLQEIADGLCTDKEMEYIRLKNQEVASLEPIDVTGENSIFVKLKDYPYEFEIDSSLHLASIDGVKLATSNKTEGKKPSIDGLPTIEGIYSSSAQNINYDYDVVSPGTYIVGAGCVGSVPAITTTGVIVNEYNKDTCGYIAIIKCNTGDKISLSANNTYWNAGGFIVKVNNFEINELITSKTISDTSVTSTYTATEDDEIILSIAFASGRYRSTGISYDNVFLTSYYHMNDCCIDVAILKKGTTVTATSYGNEWSNAVTYIFK